MNEETKCPRKPAITTRYLPETDVYPPRISATEVMGYSIITPIEVDDDAANCGSEMHIDAAIRLCNALELTGTLIGDHIDMHTMVFTWVDNDDPLLFKVQGSSK